MLDREKARVLIEDAHGKILEQYNCPGDCTPELSDKFEALYESLLDAIAAQLHLNLEESDD